jgi:hypothetical protein
MRCTFISSFAIFALMLSACSSETKPTSKVCDDEAMNNAVDRVECGFGGPSRQNLRDEFMLINLQLSRRFGDRAQLINVGTAENTGTGDPLWIALDKIWYDLDLPEAKQP